MTLERLRKRVLELSFKHGLSHIGSCLTALTPLVEIFEQRPERFVLSNGHAGLALYVILEAYRGADAEALLCANGVHPKRGPSIDCSTGSLGQGITVAVGMALAGKETYCLVSDGEASEGSLWESLAFKHNHGLKNLHVYVNMNGYSALSKVNEAYLSDRLRVFDPDIRIYQTQPDLPFLCGVDAHYRVMSKEEYETAREF